MKKLLTALLAAALAFTAAAAYAEPVTGIPFFTPSPTATPSPDAFRFRDGIRWGMNPLQVRALESTAMTERSMQDWSVLFTNEKVAVSRFTADMVFMFRQERLLMITYEFQRMDPRSDFTYLSGALSAVYGERVPADPAEISNLMDAINPNYYRTESMTEAYGWFAADGTAVYLYYFTPQKFAVMYVSPELGTGIYQTNGL